MNHIESSFYAIALAVSLLCLAVVNSAGAHGGKRRYFATYLVLEACGFALEWLLLHPATPLKALWLGLLMIVSLLIAPCLWLFAREITERQTPSLLTLPRQHVLVIGAGVLLTLPLIASTHWGVEYADPQHSVSAGQRLFIHATMVACAALFLFQVTHYLRRCIGILHSHTRDSKALFSDISDRYLDTLRLLVFIVLSGAIVKILRTLHCLVFGADRGFGIAFTSLQVSVAVAVVIVILRRSTRAATAPAALPELPAVAGDDDPKYARSALDANTRQRILAKLASAMTDKMLYLDSQLTLGKLCSELNENMHYVSQAINQDLSTTFYDLVNRYRIEHAKALLLSEPGQTVLDIALASGFNAKSTFNAAFRQHAGTTPSAYKKQEHALSA